MRRFAYFLRNLRAGHRPGIAWQKCREQTEADRPRLIDRSMDREEFDDWPASGQWYDYSHRKSIWEIVSQKLD